MTALALHDLDPRTPVLVGVGEHAEFVGDPGYRALSPADLAGEAARAAVADATADGTAGATAGAFTARAGRALAGAIDVVACVRLFEDSGLAQPTPLGRSTNLPRSVAARVGARPTRAILEIGGGQSPQHLITEFAAEIAAGRTDAVLIAGAEALSSVRHWADAPADRRPRWQEMPAGDLEDRGPGLEDMTSRDKVAVGLVGAPAAYALFENARRARLGLSRADYARRMGELFAPFTEIAAGNPLAAASTKRTAAELSQVTPRNRLIADPYPRFLVARDTVNQGAASVLTSLGRARELGLPSRRYVFLAGHADAVEQDLLRRPDLASSPASMAALRLALEVAGITADELATIDLYSCFPIAVTNAADGLRLDYDDPRGLTVTGGLPYFGGAGNNYALHAVVQTAHRLRALRDAQDGTATPLPPYGLVTANGGIMSKYSVGVYTTAPTPWHPGRSARLQAEIRGWANAPTTTTPEGDCTIATYTVVPQPDGGRLGIVLAETYDGERFLARTSDDAATWALLATEQPVGAQVGVRFEDGVPVVFAP
ncbi:MAG: acetyl-CoA acetyltransferase [Austwickia sp.]|nr:acetyl-CoA acetyltransferase [Actinomycetota bacterium]MCO5307908.1 acetyl-CoA acetyltransferase [Austwickia sp.]